MNIEIYDVLHVHAHIYQLPATVKWILGILPVNTKKSAMPLHGDLFLVKTELSHSCAFGIVFGSNNHVYIIIDI